MKNIKQLISLLTCLVIFFCAHSQDKKTLDSLLNTLNEKNIDTIQLQTNRAIGDYYMYSNNQKAVEYFETAKSIAQKLNRTLDIASNYFSIAYCNLMKGKFDIALDNYFQSVRLYEQLNDDKRLANAYLSIIGVYSESGNAKKANEYYEKAKTIIVLRNDSIQLASLYSQKGQIFYRQAMYDSALVYLNKQLEIVSFQNDQMGAISVLGNIGLLYKKINKPKEALAYCQRSLDLIYKTQGINDYAAVVFNNIGSIHAQTGNFSEAKIAFDKSIEYCKQIGEQALEMENYLNLSDMYGTMHNYKLQIDYLKKYYSLKDSSFTRDTKNQMTELEADYQLGKKNMELVKKDADIKDQRNQRNIFIILAFATLILLTALSFFYKRMQKKKVLLERLNTQINHQKDELENLNHVKDRLFSVISHDLRNPLITLRSYLLMSDNENLSTDKKLLFKNQTIQAVSQTGEMLDNLLVWANMQIKSTTVSLVPIHVKDCVRDVLSLLQAQAQQKQIVIQEDVADIIIPGDFEILTIALRNLLTNAIKFSHEKQTVYITTTQKGQHLFLIVRDEGIGISQEQILQIQQYQNISTSGTKGEKGSGLGLFLVKELLQKINAELLIESNEGEGSSFTIRLNMM